METVCLRIKVKKDALKQVHEWFRTLSERRDEVLETLENEGVFIESVFLDQINGEHYLIYYMKAQNIAHAREVAKNSKLPIDLYHKENFSKCCEERSNLTLLMDFNRFI